MSDPQPLSSPFNDPKNPQPLTNTNIDRPSIHNRGTQSINPNSVEPNQPVVTPTQPPISALPPRRKPKIAPPPPAAIPAEYTHTGGKRRTKRKNRKHKRTHKKRTYKRRN